MVMQDVVTTILTDKNTRGSAEVESLVIEQAVIAAPWAN